MTKIARIKITNQFFIELLKPPVGNTYNKLIQGLPQDAELTALYPMENKEGFVMLVRSDEFKDVPEDAEIPLITPTFKTVEVVEREKISKIIMQLRRLGL